MEFLDRTIKQFEEEIEYFNSRIADGIAHDFEKMKPIWEDNIVRLSAILRQMRMINDDANGKDGEQ